ncbi:MAG: tetratricopeptide repeat protein [Nitrospirota bacterium]
MFRFAVAAILLAVVAVLAGCAGDVAFRDGEKYASAGDWDRAVQFYRQALQKDPENLSYRTRLAKAQETASITHAERALYYLKEKNAEAAIYEATEAYSFSPTNERAVQVLADAKKLKELQDHFVMGQKYYSLGRPNEALEEFQKVLDMDPENKDAKEYMERITKQSSVPEEDRELTLASNQPITLSFKDAKLKEVFEFLSKLSGISILFDEDVKDQPVTVFAKDVSFNQALKLLLATNKLFMKKIAKDAIIIIPKTKSKIDQYQDLMIKTFYLNSIPAKEMVNIIRTMLETRKIIINEPLNAITLRDTPDKLKLCEKLIRSNDIKDAEVVIDVNIMEVDRGDSMTYGIGLPQSITGTYIPPGNPLLSAFSVVTTATGPTNVTGVSSIPSTVTTSLSSLIQKQGKAINNMFLAYPSVTLNWAETKSHAEQITNPQIRTLNKKPAKILIGSRVPIQTGTTVATAGVTTTTFEYRDVGIKLTVEPDIGFTDVTLKTTLEVSALATQPLIVGGLSEPVINTTNAEAVVNLKDGEEVIIGGLLDNITTKNISGIAGLTDVPILGKIFSTNTIGPNSKRELLMTMTPHIIRSHAIPPIDITDFWSGTEENYDTKPMFEEQKEKLSVPEETPEIEAPATVPAPSGPVAPEGVGTKPAAGASGTSPAPGASTSPASGGTLPLSVPSPSPPPAPGSQPATPAKTAPTPSRPPAQAMAQPTPKIGRVGTLAFSPDVTPVEVGKEVTVDVTANGMDSIFEAPVSIIYNPKLVQFVKAEEGNYMKVDGKPTSFMVTVNEKVGSIDVLLTRLGKVQGVSGTGTLFSLTFKGLAPGISPLVFKQNSLRDASKQPVAADLRTGTLYVR